MNEVEWRSLPGALQRGEARQSYVRAAVIWLQPENGTQDSANLKKGGFAVFRTLKLSVFLRNNGLGLRHGNWGELGKFSTKKNKDWENKRFTPFLYKTLQLSHPLYCIISQQTPINDPTAFGLKAHRPPRSILSCARMLPRPAFARHGPRGLQGDPGNLRRPSFTKVPVPCRHVHTASVDDPAAFALKADRPPRSILTRARVLPRPAFARQGLSGGSGESPATQFHQMPSLTATYMLLPSMIQILLVFRLTGPQGEF